MAYEDYPKKVRISETQLKQLKDLAKENKVSTAKQLSILLELYLKKK